MQLMGSLKLITIIGIVSVSLIKAQTHQKASWSDEEETSEYWNEQAQKELQIALQRQILNKQVAKNVIMFLGDGMSVSTITAGRIMKGQMNNQTGEEFVLEMDKFPHVGLSKTYSVDRQTTDSAATATAYLCGVKSKHGTIGLSGGVERLNCESSKGKEVDSILVDAYKAGKSTGIISTVHLVHASPAGAYAHVAERNWYSDTRITAEAEASGCKDIATQFYESSNMVTVALSGGRRFFRPTSVKDEEYPRQTGERLDGQDYIQKWLDDAADDEVRKYVWNKSLFDDVDPVSTDKILGLFDPEAMEYDIDRDPDNEPSLAEMVEKAIRILRKNNEGYFLFVEGGRIDQAHHASDAYHALSELVAMDDAIGKAVQMTSESDTLIVITSDHSHTMSLGGYTWRGNPILEKAPANYYNSLASDGKPYTSILYNNGPAYQGGLVPVPVSTRENLTDVDTTASSYRQQGAVPHASESHGGDDVAIRASGPMAHLFHGVHEQNYIAYVMRYAACIGSNKNHCMKSTPTGKPTEKIPEKTEEVITEETFVSFLAIELTLTDSLVALYVQFVIVIFLPVVVIILALLLARKQPKRRFNLESPYANASFTPNM